MLQEVQARGNTTFLALEALREADPVAYNALSIRERAEIYVDALKNSICYNAWGLPGYHLTPTAQALINLRDDAISVLEPLLGDKRPAPLSGSQDATTSTMYKNRVCDYAWVLINEIEHRPYIYFQDPAERDRFIAMMIQRLRDSKKRGEKCNL